MKNIVTLIVVTLLAITAHALIRDDGKLTIPAGISVIGTNKNYATPVISFTNMTSSNIVIYAYDSKSIRDTFRLVAVPTGAPGSIPPPRYQAIVKPMCPPIHLGPNGGTNYVGQLPATLIVNGLIVKSTGQIDTDFTPNFTVGALPTLP